MTFAERALQVKRIESGATLSRLDSYLSTTVDPSLEALSGSIQALEIAKLRNGTQRQQIEAEYAEILQTIDTVDAAVADNVLENNLANEQAITSFEAQKQSLDAISIDRPNLWNATGGLVFGKIGEGWSLLTKDVVCGMLLDPASKWLKDATKDIPVLNVVTEVGANVILDFPSGVIEGAGELVNGIATMIAHPVDALAGIGTLIGRNPQTGEWGLSNTGNAWRELGKALIAYENFERGEVGKGVGKVALNVLLTATGIGAGAKGAQGASIAYSVARASGAGVARSTLRAAGTGARLFAGEFSHGIARLPGEAVSATGKLLRAPGRLLENMKLGTAGRLGKEISAMGDELSKVSKGLEEVTIGGKKVSELKALSGKTFEDLGKLSGEELGRLGLKDAKAVRDFMAYREALGKAERLQGTVAVLSQQRELAQIAPELEKLPNLSGKKLDKFIEAFNSKHPEGFKDKFKVLTSRGDEVVVFDESGKLKKYIINESSARDVLKELKQIDERVRGPISTFEIRRECLHRNPKISTSEAYTYGDLPVGDKPALKRFLHDPTNWIPERRAFHQAVLEKTYRDALKLSERMGQNPPVVFLMRGNTAAGKTTTLRQGAHPRIARLNILDNHGFPSGAINPDDFKGILRKAEKKSEHHTISHDQTHPEGAILAEQQITRLFDEGKSIVIDKRLGPVDDVEEVVIIARQKGYKVVMVDVDAELMTSIDRVHGNPEKGVIGRNPAGDDPIVLKPVIERGFDEIRGARRATEGLVDEYYLYKTDVPKGSDTLISTTIDGKREIIQPALFAEISPVTKDHYVTQAMANLKTTSRTSAGVVDTSATAAKASSISEGLSPALAAKRANENFHSVIDFVFENRRRQFSTADELRSFVEKVATDVNGGILKDGILLRRADSAKFPYTKVADLPKATGEFYTEFFRRLNDPATNPHELAAWVEWNIDLTHHFFEDGCGKTSKAISTFVLARYGKELPRYRGRGEYYAAAESRNFTNFSNYYRTLFQP